MENIIKKIITRFLNAARVNRTINKYSMPFIISSIAIITLVITGIFIGLIFHERQTMEETLLNTARSQFHNIVITRKWNSNYGGVYVLKTPGVKENPYLENPDIYTIDKKTYTLRTPAIMLREISEYAGGEKNSFNFHITSTNPINPGNKPDAFETRAFAEIQKGAAEYFCDECVGSGHKFRYMAPLYIEPSCLNCHAKQGYREGDLRGGISVTFDVTAFKDTLTHNTHVIIILSILTIIIVVGAIGYLGFLLLRKLSRAYEKIDHMAVTDELTQLYNRHYFYPKLQHIYELSKRYARPLSCILFDIDNFKSINDTLGHQAGDDVLRSIAGIIKENCRKSDIVSRYGGEEIIILLPETSPADAASLAEKIRMTIDTSGITFNGGKLNITVSAGVAGFVAENIGGLEDVNALIKQSDDAMYSAKRKGKNRVEMYQ